MTNPGDVRDLYPEVKKNLNLSPYNTLGVQATASEYIEIRDAAELTELANTGFFRKKKPFILGGGSNILFRGDVDVPVLRISIPGIDTAGETDTHVLVRSGAGEVWHDLVRWSVDMGYGGIENLALIPGTCGAAPIQNIGAYGTELDQVFESLELFDMESESFKTYTHDQCEFGYRDSIFKRDLKGKVIVTSVTLKLKKPPHKINRTYYALDQYLEERAISAPGIKDVFEAVIAIRSSKLPDPSLIGNAGSFFKNPVIDEEEFNRLRKSYPGVPSFEAGNGKIKVPAGWLIEQAGWKGKQVGNVGTYKNQALVIVNHGKATGAEIYNHAMRIQASVKKMFGIELTPEVNIVGG